MTKEMQAIKIIKFNQIKKKKQKKTMYKTFTIKMKIFQQIKNKQIKKRVNKKEKQLESKKMGQEK